MTDLARKICDPRTKFRYRKATPAERAEYEDFGDPWYHVMVDGTPVGVVIKDRNHMDRYSPNRVFWIGQTTAGENTRECRTRKEATDRLLALVATEGLKS